MICLLFCFLAQFFLNSERLLKIFCCPTQSLQQPDSDRARSSTRNGSSSKRPMISSSRPSSSGEPSEGRSSRLVSSSSRLSSTQRVQPGFESKSSFTRAATAGTRGSRDDTLKSFELLSIGTGKRKWAKTVYGCIVLSFYWDIRPSRLFVLLRIFPSCVGVHSIPKANWNFSMKLWQTPPSCFFRCSSMII